MMGKPSAGQLAEQLKEACHKAGGDYKDNINTCHLGDASGDIGVQVLGPTQGRPHRPPMVTVHGDHTSNLVSPDKIRTYAHDPEQVEQKMILEVSKDTPEEPDDYIRVGGQTVRNEDDKPQGKITGVKPSGDKWSIDRTQS